jgi:hypothetical protein
MAVLCDSGMLRTTWASIRGVLKAAQAEQVSVAETLWTCSDENTLLLVAGPLGCYDRDLPANGRSEPHIRPRVLLTHRTMLRDATLNRPHTKSLIYRKWCIPVLRWMVLTVLVYFTKTFITRWKWNEDCSSTHSGQCYSLQRCIWAPHGRLITCWSKLIVIASSLHPKCQM